MGSSGACRWETQENKSYRVVEVENQGLSFVSHPMQGVPSYGGFLEERVPSLFFKKIFSWEASGCNNYVATFSKVLNSPYVEKFSLVSDCYLLLGFS